MILLQVPMVGSSAASVGGSATIADYRGLVASLARRQAAFRHRPEAARDIAYFSARIGQVKDAASLVADPRLLRFVLSAFGLADESQAKALIQRVLEGGWRSPTSLANRLTDPRFRELAKAFDLADPARFATAAFQSDIVARYVTAGVEQEVGASSPALRMALEFRRKAPQLGSWYQALGDRPVYELLRTALGLPLQLAQAGIEEQARLLERRIGLAKLKDPASVDRLLGRFLALHQDGGAGGAMSVAALLQPLPSRGAGL